ncbi:MAG TPA: ATP-binding protein [Pirellulales bacterium]|jgi:signal transduction histidine kinase|nr:ATP-binding protein [Pirellulales bacterium]
MSYRGVKRVLGETRLELKCLVLFAVCLLTLIGGSFWWYGSRTEDLVFQNTRNNCQYLVRAILIEEHWKYIKLLDSNRGSNGKVNSQTQGELDLINELARDILSKDLDSGAETSTGSTAADRTRTGQQFGTRLLWLTNPKPENLPETMLDSQVLEKFANAPSPTPDENGHTQEFFDYRPPDQAEYYYYQPIRMGPKCVFCHVGNSQSVILGASGLAEVPPIQEGDLMGVVRVKVSDATTQDALNNNRAIFLATAIITVFLAMIAAYAIVRYVVVKPLKHLRDISDEIARGNMEARAEIHTADEFEELGMAFNKMVRHLVSTQEEIKHANAALDVKVDELAQTNMRLYEMNRLKSDFLATMSHELRTPLNSIIGFSEVLDSIKSLDDKQRRYVQNIQKSGRVLLDMINDILDLAKIESGKMEIRLSDFRIDNVIQAQCDFFRPQTERKNIDLEIDVEPGLPELFQDQAKVQQILSNLLSNAIKFTPEGGRISVRAKHDPDPGELLFVVSDTGVGIAEEDQVVIFEKFRQGSAAMAQGDAITREHSGTGLGLSIVKELCKLLGGEVSVESQIGRGSTFTVRLPFTCAGQPQLDAAVTDNMEELMRPRRHEIQRSLERTVPAAPGVER